jgi:hypothetical protein
MTGSACPRLTAWARRCAPLPTLPAEVKQRLLDLGIEAQAGTPEEISVRLKADISKWTKVIEDAKIPKL